MLHSDGLPIPASSRVLVVAAGRAAWEVYKKYGVYTCQTHREFRPSGYVAFYADGKIQPKVAKINLEVEPIESIIVARQSEIYFLEGDQKKFAEELHKKIHLGGDLQHFEFSTPHKVVFLSGPDDSETIDLGEPIDNDMIDKNGKRMAYTQGWRYATLESLLKARTTSELENC